APKDPDPVKRWLTFLRNHREAIAAMDFFTVPTLTFGFLYCFFVIGHDRRKILHFHVVTKSPCSLGCSAVARSMGLHRAAQILAVRPRRKVWSGGGFGREGHGKRANSHGLSLSVAERCC